MEIAAWLNHCGIRLIHMANWPKFSCPLSEYRLSVTFSYLNPIFKRDFGLTMIIMTFGNFSIYFPPSTINHVHEIFLYYRVGWAKRIRVKINNDILPIKDDIYSYWDKIQFSIRVTLVVCIFCWPIFKSSTKLVTAPFCYCIRPVYVRFSTSN